MSLAAPLAGGTPSGDAAAGARSRRAQTPSGGYRRRRFSRFLALVDETLRERGACRILDLGGEVGYWTDLQDLWTGRSLRITLVNREERIGRDARFDCLVGDACSLPDLEDNAFDLVHSNSVLEHVGSWANKRLMAGEVRRLAPRYFVQTPSYWFPMEPHFRTLGFHWLPRPWRRALVMRGPRGCFHQARTLDEADWMLSDSSLLDAREMAELFPDAAIVRETVAGLTKSLIAVR